MVHAGSLPSIPSGLRTPEGAAGADARVLLVRGLPTLLGSVHGTRHFHKEVSERHVQVLSRQKDVVPSLHPKGPGAPRSRTPLQAQLENFILVNLNVGARPGFSKTCSWCHSDCIASFQLSEHVYTFGKSCQSVKIKDKKKERKVKCG